MLICKVCHIYDVVFRKCCDDMPHYRFSSKESGEIFGIYEGYCVTVAADKWAKDKFGVDFFDAIIADQIDPNDLAYFVRKVDNTY